MELDPEVLLPCPFCGGEAILLKDHKKLGLYVACTECAVCTITGKRDEATAAWNRRALTSSRSGETGWRELHTIIVDLFAPDQHFEGCLFKSNPRLPCQCGHNERMLRYRRAVERAKEIASKHDYLAAPLPTQEPKL